MAGAARAIVGEYEGNVELLRQRAMFAATSPAVSAYGRDVVLHAWERTLTDWVAKRLGVDPFSDPRPRFYACVMNGALTAASTTWLARGAAVPYSTVLDETLALLPDAD